jgi:hypothetical protein
MKKSGSSSIPNFHENSWCDVRASISDSSALVMHGLSDNNSHKPLMQNTRSPRSIKSPKLSITAGPSQVMAVTLQENELPSSSIFIAINHDFSSHSRSAIVAAQETSRIEELFTLDDWKSTQTFVGDDNNSESSTSSMDISRPPSRRRVDPRQTRIRLSELNTGGLSPIFHSSIPSIGHWICLEAIGEGSQGSIFKGTSITHEGFVFAAKLVHNIPLSEGGFDSLPEDAKIEIENMASLSHPNIVPCYGAEILGAHLYIYMELMGGGSLARYITEKGRLGELEASRFARQVLEAVYYLHSKRNRPIMHRDIKGSNVLLSEDLSRVKLCDFGSSTRQIQQNLKRLCRISPTAVAVVELSDPQSCYTSFCQDTNDLNDFVSSSIKGTCNWIAPEVLRGQPYSAMCDIWSLGCLVIEMLTGKVPWKSFENPVAAMYNIMTSDSTPIEFISDDIREDLSDACMDFLTRTLDRNKETRWTAKRLLKHPWIRSTLATIPGTPAGNSSPGTPIVTRAII